MVAPIFLPGTRMDRLTFSRLVAMLEADQTVLLRTYKSSNTATTMAAKLNRKWADGRLGLSVHVFTQAMDNGEVGMYVRR